jgi:hypothetical protein
MTWSKDRTTIGSAVVFGGPAFDVAQAGKTRRYLTLNFEL